MNKSTYEPETLEEEFALLAGRLTALESVLNADDSAFIDKKYVAAIMGIKYFEGGGILIKKKSETPRR